MAGLLIAGAIAAGVPDSFWHTFFLADHPLAAKLVGPLVGSPVAIATFVRPIGNVPPAVVLWKGASRESAARTPAAAVCRPRAPTGRTGRE